MVRQFLSDGSSPGEESSVLCSGLRYDREARHVTQENGADAVRMWADFLNGSAALCSLVSSLLFLSRGRVCCQELGRFLRQNVHMVTAPKPLSFHQQSGLRCNPELPFDHRCLLSSKCNLLKAFRQGAVITGQSAVIRGESAVITVDEDFKDQIRGSLK